MLERILPAKPKAITVEDTKSVNFYFEMTDKAFKVNLDSDGEVTGTDLERLLKFRMSAEQFAELLEKATLFQQKTEEDIFKSMVK